MSQGITRAVFYPSIWLANDETKAFTSRISFCRSGSQTLFFGGREATKGNTSAVRMLGLDRKVRYCPLFRNRLLGVRVIRREQNSRWTLTRAKPSFISGVKTGSMLVCRQCDCTSGNLNKTSVKRKVPVPVPENPISAKPGLKILFHLLYLPSYALLRVTFYVIITESRGNNTAVFVAELQARRFASRVRGSPWLRKSTHPRKFRNHVTVRRTTVRPHHRQTNVYFHTF